MPKWVSVAALARALNVSYAAVTTAINKGRLRDSIQQSASGRYQIDLDKALQEWEQNTDVIKAQNAYSGQSSATIENHFTKPIKSAAPAFSESRAIKEAYLARLAKLEYEERVGQLVSAEDVKEEAFKLARIVRDALLNIPERLSAELAAETDSHRIHQRLKAALIDVLQELTPHAASN